MKFGPLRLKTLATRPAMTLESSPGIVSSVIGPKPAFIDSMISSATVSRSLGSSFESPFESRTCRRTEAVYTRRSVASFLGPPMALPKMTAVREESKGFLS